MKKTIRRSVQMKKKARAAGANEAGRLNNLAKAAENYATLNPERQALIEGMNNWQKSQYMRAKKPGVEMPLDQVRMFATAKKAG